MICTSVTGHALKPTTKLNYKKQLTHKYYSVRIIQANRSFIQAIFSQFACFGSLDGYDRFVSLFRSGVVHAV